MTTFDFSIAIPHEDFQQYVKKRLQERGWILLDSGYHDFLPKSVVQMIHASNHLTDLYYRALPDLLVVNPYNQKERFFIDIKTSQNSHAYIEAFPWAANIQRENIQTLYLYYNKQAKYAKAWTATDPLVLQSIDNFIYRKCKLLPPEAIDIIKKYLINTPHNINKIHFPQTPTDRLPPDKVSGDCTTVIRDDKIKYFQDIRIVVDRYLPYLNGQ